MQGINEGRMAAREIDLYLMGKTRLPVTGGMYKHGDNTLSENALAASKENVLSN